MASFPSLTSPTLFSREPEGAWRELGIDPPRDREGRCQTRIDRWTQEIDGDIEDVRVSSAAGYLIAEFKQAATGKSKGKRWFEAGQQSDGTLRVAGLLTALLQSPSLPVIGLEEPELTVHPGALPMLYDYLLQASGVSQVIVTTHSPLILDVVELDRTTLLVVERHEGTTSVRQVTGQELDPVKKKLLSLGDLYLSGGLQTAFTFS